MIHPAQFPNKTARRKRLLLAAACLATFTVGSTGAVAGSPQCGCSDSSCDVCDDGHGPIYKALDSVAGGIEKLLFLGMKRRGGCDDMMCGDGCDAMPMGEMMMMSEEPRMPMQMDAPMMMQPMTSHPTHSYPTHAQPMHQHVEPSLPPTPSSRLMRSSPTQQTAPSAPMRMSEPRMSPMPKSPMSIPRPAPLPDNRRDATGSGILPPSHRDNGSMFDSLQDPFRDDSAQLNAPRNDSSSSTTARTASYRGSSRRTNAAR